MPKSHFLKKELETLEFHIDQGDLLNKNISMASVKWHLQHILLVINKIMKVLEASNPEDYKSNFNLNRSFVFTINKIPRGRGKAPKQVRPDRDISKELILESISAAREQLRGLETLEEKRHFSHTYFGMLNKKQTMKFIKMHTVHHLKIIRDITA